MTPMAMAIPLRLMMLELMPQPVHDDEGDQHTDRQHHDGDQGTAHMKEKQYANQSDYEAFLDQFVAQVLDGFENQHRAIIDGRYGNACR
jgi:hypothetical protein